mgnify:CR=1 FL=1
MDDVAINEFSSVEHWEPPFTIIVTRAGVRVQDRKPETVAAVYVPMWYSTEDKARVGMTVKSMLELRHANWEASL